MRSGELKHRIEIQTLAKTPDGMGGFTNVYTTLETIWAAIWPTSAGETIQANSPTMAISHRIRIRYRNPFRANWRIKFGTRYFSIVSIINPNEDGKLLDLMCREAAK